MFIWDAVPAQDFIHALYYLSIVVLLTYGFCSKMSSKKAVRWGIFLSMLVAISGTAIFMNVDWLAEMARPSQDGKDGEREIWYMYAFFALNLPPFVLFFLSAAFGERFRRGRVRDIRWTPKRAVTRARKEQLVKANQPEYAGTLENVIEKGLLIAGEPADADRIRNLRIDIGHGLGFYDHERSVLVLDIGRGKGIVFDITDSWPYIEARI